MLKQRSIHGKFARFFDNDRRILPEVDCAAELAQQEEFLSEISALNTEEDGFIALLVKGKHMIRDALIAQRTVVPITIERLQEISSDLQLQFFNDDSDIQESVATISGSFVVIDVRFGRSVGWNRFAYKSR